MTGLTAIATAISVLEGCTRTAPAVGRAARQEQFELAREFIAPRPPARATGAERFGGISGLAPLMDGREMLAISDDREESRFYRIAIEWTASAFRVTQVRAVPLQPGNGAPAMLDPEAIAVTQDGHILIASEGIGNEEPRLPPSLLEYSADGHFIRQLHVRPRYAPNERGTLTMGVRSNAGFESLTLAPDFSRLYTATELPLAQDGDANAFARGNRSRILEYAASGDSYEPRREFAYEIEPLEPVRYVLGFAVNGIVELLSLGGDELLVLERGYVESLDHTQSINRIRLFRVTLAGATDISAWDSLRKAAAEESRLIPVKKTLVLDLNKTPGLSPRLATLDNFEGMAWGPTTPGSDRRPLVLVSDDNFNSRQVTAFLLLRSLEGNH